VYFGALNGGGMRPRADLGVGRAEGELVDAEE